MKALSAFVDIVAPSELFGFWESLLSHFIIKRIDETIFLFFWEKSWDHTDGQNIVDELKETFFSNMRVSEEESSWFIENAFVKISEILPEILLSVSSDKTDSEDIISCSEGC